MKAIHSFIFFLISIFCCKYPSKKSEQHFINLKKNESTISCVPLSNSTETKVSLQKKEVIYSLTTNIIGNDFNAIASKIEKKIQLPIGMVYIPSGITHIGSNTGLGQEKPVFRIVVRPFFMDKHPVTVQEFRLFVQNTKYITEAEKFGNAGVIDSSTGNKWILKDGANWEYPQGKDYPKAHDNHPVTQVSWNDANAYCKWVGKRLPTEFEFEFASKNAHDSNNLYPWGNSLIINGKYMANVWQGTFPQKNEVKDGFKFSSPVGYFGYTPLGLSDMSGNVWQWCSNDKFSYNNFLAALNSGISIRQTPEKAMRGGSYLCEPSWCHGYRVTARSGATPETALMHVGFRCVKDIN